MKIVLGCYLLRHQGRRYTAVELVRSVEEKIPSKGNSLYRDMSEERLTKESLYRTDFDNSEGGDIAKIFDEDTLRNYKERLEDLREQKYEADDSHNYERSETLQQEIEFMLEHIKSDTFRGKMKEFKRPLDSKRSGVKKRITCALEKIEKHDECLWRYLRNSIITGNAHYYNPDPNNPIDWSL